MTVLGDLMPVITRELLSGGLVVLVMLREEAGFLAISEVLTVVIFLVAVIEGRLTTGFLFMIGDLG